METNNRLPTGEWNGFYLEEHQPKRGWMHLYMAFADGKVKGEGTDYVGPWTAVGQYDIDSGQCSWTKHYLGKHSVHYRGQATERGIIGQWDISNYLTGEFHIWPQALSELNELYLQQDLQQPGPSEQLGTVPTRRVDFV